MITPEQFRAAVGREPEDVGKVKSEARRCGERIADPIADQKLAEARRLDEAGAAIDDAD